MQLVSWGFVALQHQSDKCTVLIQWVFKLVVQYCNKTSTLPIGSMWVKQAEIWGLISLCTRRMFTRTFHWFWKVQENIAMCKSIDAQSPLPPPTHATPFHPLAKKRVFSGPPCTYPHHTLPPAKKRVFSGLHNRRRIGWEKKAPGSVSKREALTPAWPKKRRDGQNSKNCEHGEGDRVQFHVKKGGPLVERMLIEKDIQLFPCRTTFEWIFSVKSKLYKISFFPIKITTRLCMWCCCVVLELPKETQYTGSFNDISQLWVELWKLQGETSEVNLQKPKFWW